MANHAGDSTSPEAGAPAGVQQTADITNNLYMEVNGLRTARQAPRVGDTNGGAAAPHAAGAPAVAGPPDQSCKEADRYKDMVGQAERRIFDVNSLGDRKKLELGFDCRTDKDPVKVANKNLFDATGDGYNFVMTPQQWRDRQISTRGVLGGIGAEITGFEMDKSGKPIFPPHTDNPPAPRDIDPKTLKTGVAGIVPGTPAAAAGLQKGDIILKVDQTDATRVPMDKTVEAIRGVPGTRLHMTVSRDGQTIDKDITRAQIKVPTVDEPQDRNGYTYIRVKSFGSETANELQAAMQKFPNTKGFAIDVRDNPGGLVDTVEDASELFVRKGGIVNIEERVPSNPDKAVTKTTKLSVDDQHERMEVSYSDNPASVLSKPYPRAKPYLAGDKPVVLLTNGKTASAGEIFTGALGDSGVVVVGSGGDPKKPENKGTFGKGIGQTLFPEDGAGMEVTSLHYTSPSGTWPGDAAKHRYGLKPDIVVNNADGVELGSPQDAQLNAALHELEEQTQGRKHKTVIQ